MRPLEITRFATKLICGIGVSRLVQHAVPLPPSIVDELLVRVGQMAVAAVVAHQAESLIDTAFDTAEESLQTAHEARN